MLLGYQSTKRIKLIYIVATLGTIIEWYDFDIYAYLAPVFSHQFFVSKNHLTSMLLVYTVFFISFLARPLGGLLYGFIGDNFGRKQALMLSIGLMTISMFITMSLPTWQTIGNMAMIFLLIFRILQGFSTGGELSGAFIYVLESSDYKRRGMYGSTIWAMGFAGALLASAVSGLLNHFLSHDQLFHWGWRIAYLVAGIIGAIIFILRSFLPESIEFSQAQKLYDTEEKMKPILSEVLMNYKSTIFTIVILAALPSAAIYFTFIYFPHYIHQYFHYPYAAALNLNTIMLFVMLVAILVCGILSDYIGRKKMILLSTICFLFFTYPILYLLIANKWGLVIMTQLLLTLMIAVYIGTLPALIFSLTKLRVRYTVFSLGYNIAFSLFGGSMPLIAEQLAYQSSNYLAPAFYLIGLSLLSLLALILLYFQRDKMTVAFHKDGAVQLTY